MNAVAKLAVAAVLACGAVTATANADPVADFYKGKTITILVADRPRRHL